MLCVCQKAQDEVEALLKTAEMLALKGDTQGQRDQIIGELMRVHTRFQARVSEYHTLLKMAVKFFQDLAKVCSSEENKISRSSSTLRRI